VDATRLIVIDDASRQTTKVPPAGRDVHGAIVWYEPLADATDAEVAKVVNQLREAGALKVVVLPRVTADQELPQQQVEQAAAAFSGGAAQARAVAAELIVAAQVDAETARAAGELVERYLVEAGL
jgi:hypothetical protein